MIKLTLQIYTFLNKIKNTYTRILKRNHNKLQKQVVPRLYPTVRYS